MVDFKVEYNSNLYKNLKVSNKRYSTCHILNDKRHKYADSNDEILRFRESKNLDLINKSRYNERYSKGNGYDYHDDMKILKRKSAEIIFEDVPHDRRFHKKSCDRPSLLPCPLNELGNHYVEPSITRDRSQKVFEKENVSYKWENKSFNTILNDEKSDLCNPYMIDNDIDTSWDKLGMSCPSSELITYRKSLLGDGPEDYNIYALNLRNKRIIEMGLEDDMENHTNMHHTKSTDNINSYLNPPCRNYKLSNYGQIPQCEYYLDSQKDDIKSNNDLVRDLDINHYIKEQPFSYQTYTNVLYNQDDYLQDQYAVIDYGHKMERIINFSKKNKFTHSSVNLNNDDTMIINNNFGEKVVDYNHVNENAQSDIPHSQSLVHTGTPVIKNEIVKNEEYNEQIKSLATLLSCIKPEQENSPCENVTWKLLKLDVPLRVSITGNDINISDCSINDPRLIHIVRQTF